MSDFHKLECTPTGVRINPYKVKDAEEPPFPTQSSDSIWIIRPDWQKRPLAILATKGQTSNPIGDRCSVKVQHPTTSQVRYGVVIGYVSRYGKKYGEVPIHVCPCYRMSET